MKAKSTKTKTTARATKPARKSAVKPKAAPKPAPRPAPKAAKPGAKAAKPAAAKPSPPLRAVAPPPKKAKPTAAFRKEMEHFRALLLEKQSELTQAYAVSKEDSRSHLDNGTEDYIDYAVNSYAKEFLLSLTELDRKQLLLVRDALRRIDRGEYGRCQQCGEEINRKRLEVAPWARHCVRCQELEEQGLLPQSAFPADEADLEALSEKAGDDEDLAPEAEVEEEEPDVDEEPLSIGDEEEEDDE